MGVAEKVDHLKLCNSHKIPFEDFHRQFCSGCYQPECTRSLHGLSKFEDRVLNWEKRLFVNIPRMDSGDPRFKDLSAKKFLEVVQGPAGRPSEWLDPKDVETKRTISIPEPPKLEEPPKPAAPPPQTPAPVFVPEIHQVPRNTPNRPRQMIGGADPKPSPPVLDPWQPKQELQPGEKLIQPGARIKFGQ